MCPPDLSKKHLVGLKTISAERNDLGEEINAIKLAETINELIKSSNL